MRVRLRLPEGGANPALVSERFFEFRAMASSAALVLPSATCAPSGLRHPPVVNACAGAPSVPTSIAFVSGAFAGQRVSQRVWNSRVTERVASVSVRASAAESTKELERFSAKGDLLLSVSPFPFPVLIPQEEDLALVAESCCQEISSRGGFLICSRFFVTTLSNVQLHQH